MPVDHRACRKNAQTKMPLMFVQRRGQDTYCYPANPAAAGDPAHPVQIYRMLII